MQCQCYFSKSASTPSSSRRRIKQALVLTAICARKQQQGHFESGAEPRTSKMAVSQADISFTSECASTVSEDATEEREGVGFFSKIIRCLLELCYEPAKELCVSNFSVVIGGLELLIYACKIDCNCTLYTMAVYCIATGTVLRPPLIGL